MGDDQYSALLRAVYGYAPSASSNNALSPYLSPDHSYASMPQALAATDENARTVMYGQARTPGRMVRQGLADYLGGAQAMQPKSVSDLGYFVPGLGNVLSAQDAYNAFSNRDYFGGTLAGIGAIPLLGGTIASSSKRGAESMLNGEKVIGKHTLSPNDLIFRETEQNNLPFVRSEYPHDFPVDDPIIVSRTENGPLILDGHNRATVAMERGQNIPALSINDDVYKKLLSMGFDETDISHAMLSHSGYDEAASGIRRKFPGVNFFKNDDKITPHLED